MKYFLRSLLIIGFLISFEARSATVTALINSTPINFGTIAPGTSAGKIISCAPTVGVKILSGCRDGSVVISATNNNVVGSAPAEVTNGRKIRIFLISPTTLTSGSNSINSGAAIAAITIQTGCTQVSAGILECTNPISTVGNVKTWTIPILGNIKNISTTQASGNYSGNYSLIACSCCAKNGVPNLCATAGCPTTSTEARCTEIDKSKTLSSTIPARIATPLSFSSGVDLNFGAIASGASAGTVNQAGTATGGVTALASSGTNPRNAGGYIVIGEPSVSYNFTFPTSVSLTGPGTAMTATLSYATGGSSRIMPSFGNDSVTINGVLSVNANQVPGTYSATYAITINY